MIETVGLPGLIAAADAAAKAADVKVVRYEGVDAGIVTVYVIGDVSSVQAAVAAGAAVARQVGQLRHFHVIPGPDESVHRLIRKLLNTRGSTQAKGSDDQELEQKSIAEIRKIARTIPNFPLSPQEITLAKKDELIRHIQTLKKEGSEQDK
ncbi:BMC domain-containing protein [Brevibacillus sp. SYP-B805]|nr:BMC domain-containing protein [Brevibacillus sp. SYP-B805]NGQ96923.1 BMC domain-containing protein [Brevibacillus sp. SYP-B805]